MTNITIRVSDFSTTPFGRFKNEGSSNGELFREMILRPAFEKYDSITIELDGTYGYPSSFREEAFGGLVREIKNIEKVKNKLKFISKDNPLIIDKIIKNIEKALS